MSEPLVGPTRTHPGLTVKNKVGLVLAALLGLSDLPGAFTLGEPVPGEEGPPQVVLIAGVVLGLVTLVAAAYTWRTGNRIGSRVVAGSRILSLITALPAFFVDGVPGFLVALVAVAAVLTIVAVGLVLSRPAP
jgi:hypothetical protein